MGIVYAILSLGVPWPGPGPDTCGAFIGKVPGEGRLHGAIRNSRNYRLEGYNMGRRQAS